MACEIILDECVKAARLGRMKPVLLSFVAGAALFAAGCDHSNLTTAASAAPSTNSPPARTNQAMSDRVIKSDDEWRKDLSP